MTRRTKKRLIALGVGGVLVIGIGLLAVYGREYQQDKRAAAAYETGMAAYERADYPAALRSLNTYISRNQDDAETMYVFAVCRARVEEEDLRHIRRATVLAREAAALAPDDPRPLELLLELYPQIGFLAEYRDAAKRLIVLDPDNRMALNAVVQASIVLRDEGAAIEALGEWIAAHPQDVETSVLKANLIASHADVEDAIASMQALIEEHPSDPRPLLGLARIRLLADDIDAAATLVLDAANLDAPDVQTLGQIVDALDRLRVQSNDERYSEELERYFERQVEHETIGDAAASLRVIRNWKHGGGVDVLAVEQLDLAALPTLLVGWLGFIAGADAGSDPLMDRCMNELIGRDESETLSWRRLLEARQAMRDQNVGAGLVHIELAVNADPANAAAAYMHSIIEAELGEWRAASDRLEAISSADPLWVHPILIRAQLLLQQGRATEAKTIARNAIALLQLDNPTELRLALLVIDAMLAEFAAGIGRSAELDQAGNLLTRIEPETAGFGPILVRQARIESLRRDSSRLSAVLDELEQAEYPATPDELASLWDAIRIDHAELGARVLELAKVIEPEHPRILMAQAVDLYERGEGDQAFALLDEAIATRDGAEKLALLQVMATFADGRRPERALEVSEVIVEAYSHDPIGQRAVLDLESTWTRQGLVDDAVANLRDIFGDASNAYRLARARALLAFAPPDEVQEQAAMVAQILRPVLVANPNDATARMLLAQADLALDDRDAALTNLRIASGARSSNLSLELQLIEILQSAGETSEAAARLRDSLRSQELPLDLRRRRLRLLEHAGMWDDALSECEIVAQSGVDLDRAHLARLYVRAGRTGDALAVHEALAADESTSGAVLIDTAMFIANVDFDRGVDLLEQGLAKDEQVDAIAARVALYERQGRLDLAREALIDEVEDHPSAQAWQRLAQFHFRHKELDEAAIVIANGLNSFPDDAMLRAIDANLKGDVDAQQKAVADIFVNLAARFDSVEMAALADALEAADQPAEYIRRLRDVTIEHPRVAAAWWLLVAAYRDADDDSNAIMTARAGMRAIPTDVRLAETATVLLAEAGRFDEALEAGRTWRRRMIGETYDADVVIARIEVERGNIAQAMQTLGKHRDRIIASADDAPADLQFLATTLAAAGRPDEAHELLWSRAQAGGDWLRAFITAAFLIPRDLVDTRAKWIDGATDLVRANADLLAYLIGSLYETGIDEGNTDLLGRITQFESYVHEGGLDPKLLNMMAASHQLLGADDEAERLYEAANERGVTNPDALNNLAYLIYQRGGDLERAASLARQAVDVSEHVRPSKRREFYDTLGQILLKLNQPRDARQAFEDAIALDATAAHLHLGRARALAALGEDSAARVALDEAERRASVEQRGPDFLDEVSRVRATLKSP